MDRWLVSIGIALVVASGVAAGLLGPPAPVPPAALPARTPFFPSFPASTNVTLISVETSNATERVTAASLQGIVNAQSARIYLGPDPRSEIDTKLVEVLRTRHGVTTSAASLEVALRMFASEIAGLVIYDPGVPESVNVGTTLSGIRRGLLVTPPQAAVYGPALGLAVLEDLREPPWRGLSGPGLYRAALSRLLASANPSVLGYLRPDRHGPRDYLIAAGSFVFYADAGPLAGTEDVALLREVLAATPANVAMIGWVRTTTGAEENFLIQETSRAGKVFVGGEDIPNLSLLSAFPPAQPLRQGRTNGTPVLEDKVYVSFAIPDGDHLDFVRGRMYDLWRQPPRGSLPIAWSISPALTEIAPAYLELLYGNASPNDTFVAAPSGLGYVYPGLLPGDTLSTFLSETAVSMGAADLRVAWLLNTYRGYEVPYPGDVLADYARELRPDGILLDYGDRATGPSYWMVDDIPATRSVHYWSSLENLQEKVRLDLESVGGPHFLVVTLYPFTKDLADLDRAANGIAALAPGRVEFVPIERLFSLLLRRFPQWAEETAAAVAGDPLVPLLAPGPWREGMAALETARSAGSVGDYRTAAKEGYRAVQRFHEASAASSIAPLVLVPSVAIVLAMFALRARIRGVRVERMRAAAPSAVTAAALTALLISGTIRILDANFWDLLALPCAVLLIGVLLGIPDRWIRHGAVEWIIACAATALGVGILIWSAYGLVPLAFGAAVLLRRVRRSHALNEGGWLVSVGFGGLIGVGLGWNPIAGVGLLAASVLGSVLLPPPVHPSGPPGRRGALGQSAGSLLSVVPLAAILVPWTAFFSVRTDWNATLLIPAAGVVLVLAPSLGAAFAASGRAAWNHFAAAGVLSLAAANFLGGLPLLLGVLFGLAFLVAACARLQRPAPEVATHEGVAFAGLVISLVTLARLQPVYFSVYVWAGPAGAQYAMHHPLVLVALIAGVAALLIAVTGRGPR